MESVDEKMKMALSVCMSVADSMDAMKEQLQIVRESWKRLEGEVKEMEEQKKMEESLNDKLDFDELMEG